MIRKQWLNCVVALSAVCAAGGAWGQTSVSEDFTGTNTNNPWYFFNGACLTAGTRGGTEPNGARWQMPGCTAIRGSYYNENLVGGQNGIAGNNQTLPDPLGQGALRFTNGSPGGYAQNGGIVSTTPFPTGQGIAVTFKTVTYRGNSGGAGRDGADGISFYLMDASALDTTDITGTYNGDGNGLGSWGGSLGYTCSNANPPFNGLIGGYLGLGIDEYGNFLNGVAWMPGYRGPNSATGDNSALGYGYKPGRIGLRGAGNVAWNWLNANYPLFYPNTFTVPQQQAAVRNTCRNGVVYDQANNRIASVNGKPIPIYDYAPIPNAYVELPAGVQIANEAAMSRPAATPIFYKLRISESGILSLHYSINGGAYQAVILGQDITLANGPLPANFLFGFAGSTGGSTNIHEILCFKADPSTSAGSSTGASERQSAKLETGAQAYFAYYNPSGWTGRVTASGLGFDPYGNVIVASTPNWDAACTLTGVAAAGTCPTTGATGPIPAEGFNQRAILSYNGVQGIPLRWPNLTAAQQAALDAGDSAPLNANRLNYLRGERANEINTSGVGLFRPRTNLIGDIIDSSPVWVGPPIAPYTSVWSDRIHAAAPLPENNAGAQTYTQFLTNAATRLNVVYTGANDGLLHGFRSGSYDRQGNFVNSAATPNDGLEVLAYMPNTVLQSIHSLTASADFPNPQYAHAFFVDAAPATGDLFYGNQWHTWVVGGLGPGGAAIFALDVTDPTTFSEANAQNLVIGEWAVGTFTCANVPNCTSNLGNTYGTPEIRRLHDGKWAVIFGNGFGSASGDAGIFVMTIDPVSAARTFYYLSTGVGSPGSPNGIAFPAAADFDGDHITDYVYAGDLQGNLWRFDLTSGSEASWSLTPGPLFTTPAGQPITTQPVIASGAASAGAQPQIMVLFGTGQKVPLTTLNPATFSNGTQDLYGVWDWNVASWNAQSTTFDYASLTGAQLGAMGIGGNHTLGKANLQQQTVTINAATQNRDMAAPNAVCWAGPPACAASPKFGWYLDLPGIQEQVIYSPQLVAQALTVNSVVPAPNIPTSCANLSDTGFTYVISAMTGAAFFQVFLPPSEANNAAVNTNPRYTDTQAAAMQTNATGSSFITANNAGTKFLVYETNQVQSGNANDIQGGALGLNLPPNVTGRRLSWVERR